MGSRQQIFIEEPPQLLPVSEANNDHTSTSTSTSPAHTATSELVGEEGSEEESAQDSDVVRGKRWSLPALMQEVQNNARSCLHEML